MYFCNFLNDPIYRPYLIVTHIQCKTIRANYCLSKRLTSAHLHVLLRNISKSPSKYT